MKQRKYGILLVILCALSLLLFLIPPIEADARAGGGQRYRSPSRSYGGSRSFGGSKSFGGSSSSQRSHDRRSGYNSGYHGGYGYPIGGGSFCGPCMGCGGCGSIGGIIGLLVIILVIVMIFKLLNKNKDGGGGNGFFNGGPDNGGYPPDDDYQNEVMALPPIDESQVRSQLALLKDKDPNFSEKVFLDKVQTAFFSIQRAWSKNDLEPARKLMSESQFERMNMQIEEYKERGRINKIEDIVIGGVKTAEAGVEGDYDYVKVRIHASMSDKTFDSSGKIIEGSNQIMPMAEYWTFVRKTGAKTNTDGGRTVSHNCPSCGAPIEEGESSKCPYCGTMITAASFDWVLDTITQSSEEA